MWFANANRNLVQMLPIARSLAVLVGLGFVTAAIARGGDGPSLGVSDRFSRDVRNMVEKSKDLHDRVGRAGSGGTRDGGPASNQGAATNAAGNAASPASAATAKANSPATLKSTSTSSTSLPVMNSRALGFSELLASEAA